MEPVILSLATFATPPERSQGVVGKLTWSHICGAADAFRRDPARVDRHMARLRFAGALAVEVDIETSPQGDRRRWLPDAVEIVREARQRMGFVGPVIAYGGLRAIDDLGSPDPADAAKVRMEPPWDCGVLLGIPGHISGPDDDGPGQVTKRCAAMIGLGWNVAVLLGVDYHNSDTPVEPSLLHATIAAATAAGARAVVLTPMGREADAG